MSAVDTRYGPKRHWQQTPGHARCGGVRAGLYAAVLLTVLPDRVSCHNCQRLMAADTEATS
jgi:hypothetical protein